MSRASTPRETTNNITVTCVPQETLHFSWQTCKRKAPTLPKWHPADTNEGFLVLMVDTKEEYQ